MGASVRVCIAIVVLILLIVMVWKYSYREGFDANLPPLQGNDVPGLPFRVRVYDSGRPGKTVLMVGGVHGNEPAGAHGLINFCTAMDQGQYKLSAGKLVVVPMANTWGLNNYDRSNGQLLNSDINRNFTTSGPADAVSKALATLLTQADFVLDFHEGWGYHKINSDSIGSTCSSSSGPLAQQLAQGAVALLNSQITNPGYRFTHRVDEACDITTTLGCASQKAGLDYILTETTGQNEIQARSQRVSQVLTVVGYVLTQLGVISQ